MANLMTQIYIGYVEEIIYKNQKPTLELRVRIPTVHGENESTGLKKENLPIAKPIVTPGVNFNAGQLIEQITNTNKVFVIFEAGDKEKPLYFGIKGNESLYEIPTEAGPVERANLTFAQSEDPALTQTVINGDLWFDTSE